MEIRSAVMKENEEKLKASQLKLSQLEADFKTKVSGWCILSLEVLKHLQIMAMEMSIFWMELSKGMKTKREWLKLEMKRQALALALAP